MEIKLLISLEDLASFILEYGENPLIKEHSVLGDAFDLSEIRGGNYSSISRYMLETQNWEYIDSMQRQSKEHLNITFFPDVVGFSITYIDFDCGFPLDTRLLLKHIHDFSDWVFRSYENMLYPMEQDAWDIGVCSGDDDVDYNSSYLDVVVALLEAYLFIKHKATPGFYIQPS